MYNAIDVANYVLGYHSHVKACDISNFKLQSELYFLQANHLLAIGTPLFGDEIEAVNYGPLIRSVDNTYRIYGCGSIFFFLIDTDRSYERLINSSDQEFINVILDRLEPYSSVGLLQIIQQQEPWRKAYYDPCYGKIITKQLLYDYFVGLSESTQ